MTDMEMFEMKHNINKPVRYKPIEETNQDPVSSSTDFIGTFLAWVLMGIPGYLIGAGYPSYWWGLIKPYLSSFLCP